MDIPQNPRILALIPAYNEEQRLAPVVAQAKNHLPVLVVDDGSRDGTAQTAEAAGARVHVQNPNQGKGMALKHGFRMGLEEGYEGILTLDADGQHDPEEIPKFLQAFHGPEQPDLIIGARDFRRMPLVRRLSNKVGTYWFSWAMGCPIRDNQSGYRLLSRRLAQTMLESRETGYEFEVDMIATCVEREWPLSWVPIRTIYGDEVSHINPVRHTLEFFRIVRETRRRMHGK